MDKAAVLRVMEPYNARLIQVMHDAHADFTQLITPEAQPTVLRSRAKFTSCRLAYRAEQEFGSKPDGRAWMAKCHGMDILFVQGTEFDIGLRFKKLDGENHTSNHQSEQQDELRVLGRYDPQRFPELNTPTVHLFIGYRQTAGLQGRLKEIAYTFERQSARGGSYVAWHEPIWNSLGGDDPQKTDTDPLPFDLPPTWGVQPKRRVGDTEANRASG